MGLDFFELLLDVERWFGITILDSPRERLDTIGDLYAFLLKHVGGERSEHCSTGQAFYLLRRVMIGELGVDRALVRPASHQRDLLPAQTPATAWPRLEAALGVSGLPNPDPPPRGPTARAFHIATAAVTIGAWLIYLLICIMPDGPAPVFVGALIWVLSLVLVGEVFGILWLDGRVISPVRIPKVRDLVLRVAAQPNGALTDGRAARIWASLAAIISARTGIAAHEIHPDDGPDDLARRMR
jgi:hypothetical protein